MEIALIGEVGSSNLNRTAFRGAVMSEPQTKPESFESALTEFESLVERMERGDLSLEDSVGAYERGVVLHRYCEAALSAADRKIRFLTDGSGEGGGTEALQPFEPEPGSPAAEDEGASAPPSPDPARHRAGASETDEDDIPF